MSGSSIKKYSGVRKKYFIKISEDFKSGLKF